MSNLLFIETSGPVCSIALSLDGEIHELNVTEKNAHSRILAPLCKKLLEKHSIAPRELDALAVSSGPGSYTGLRIGTSFAKGMCYALNLPLIGVRTLETWTSKAMAQHPNAKSILALIDARRMDAYMSIAQLGKLEEVFVTIDDDFLKHYQIDKNTVICGSGSAKISEHFPQCEALTIKDTELYASDMASIVQRKFEAKEFENLLSFEPNYAKSVFITKPKPKF